MRIIGAFILLNICMVSHAIVITKSEMMQGINYTFKPGEKISFKIVRFSPKMYYVLNVSGSNSAFIEYSLDGIKSSFSVTPSKNSNSLYDNAVVIKYIGPERDDELIFELVNTATIDNSVYMKMGLIEDKINTKESPRSIKG